ncbi:MAG: UDP-3-O-(3-hydroxymyristoyl)glucosamine N-acyltransferase [Chitinophagales bacterium]
MKLHAPISLSDCAAWLQCPFAGDGKMEITGINEIHKVEAGDITFVDFAKYYQKALTSAASFVIINKEVDCPEGKGLIFSDDPFRDYVKLVKRFSPFNPSLKNISDTAVIGDNTIIFPGVYIGNNCTIGNNCILHPNVVVYDNTTIGDNVIIHANTTIGADAFYFKKRAEHFDKLESCGRVIIHDGVEIGAGCTIDKGVSGDTIIGEQTKMDNHIHIGHGVVVGKMCLFAGQVGIGGKTIIGDRVILWGQVGVSKDLHIGDGVVVLAQSGVGNDLVAGKTYFGSPAIEARKMWREMANTKSMSEWWENIKGKP